MSRLRATTPAETSRVCDFLAGVFRCPLDAHTLQPPLMKWKYFEPRPDWSEPRSVVLESKGELVSHGCIWPMTFVTGAGEVRGSQIVDWAADPRSPGAGLLLRREVQKLVNVSAAIGGSEETRRIMPRAGYATRGMYRTYARVVRPLRQFRTRQERPMWKRVARAGRNAAWTLPSLPPVPGSWTVRPVMRFAERDLPAPDARPSGWVPVRRTAALLNFLLGCPGAQMCGYVIEHERRPVGTLLLSEVHGKTRIADLQLPSDSAVEWHNAVLAASHAAADLPETCEIVAPASLELMGAPLIAAGFRERSEQPVFILDREGALPDLPIHIAPVDYDDFFAFDPAYPYVT